MKRLSFCMSVWTIKPPRSTQQLLRLDDSVIWDSNHKYAYKKVSISEAADLFAIMIGGNGNELVLSYWDSPFTWLGTVSFSYRDLMVNEGFMREEMKFSNARDWALKKLPHYKDLPPRLTWYLKIKTV